MLLFKLLELSSLPLDLSLLFGQVALHVLFLLLPCLHLIANQSATHKPDCGISMWFSFAIVQLFTAENWRTLISID